MAQDNGSSNTAIVAIVAFILVALAVLLFFTPMGKKFLGREEAPPVKVELPNVRPESPSR